MDLKPSELMQIEVSVAYSCIIYIVVRIEIAGIMQKISRCMFLL